MFHNIADTVNPETGKTYREENHEKTHNIPLHSLVETGEGLRLWVVEHSRDCDGTPLYSLSFNKEWSEDMAMSTIAVRFNKSGGHPEEDLKIIKRG